MSHHDPIRPDKTCQNCGHEVAERFCGNCGQENVETRKNFHQLFFHFFEDLTHYENAFWKTIFHLITKPGKLTKEYLSGKRMSYLAPIRLYIFISFVTFFLMAVVPEKESKTSEDFVEINEKGKKIAKPLDSLLLDSLKLEQQRNVQEMVSQGYMTKSQGDKLNSIIKSGRPNGGSWNIFGYESVEQLDSMQRYGPKSEKLGKYEYLFMSRLVRATSENTKAEFFEKFKEAFAHNFPKVLFIYMPIFAFCLWLFQDKKRWYYFDHGIFTLHYFSFILLCFLIISVCKSLCSYLGTPGSILRYLITIPLWLWILYYFFPAHHRFFGESRTVSAIKGICLLFINIVIMTIIMILYVLFTFLMIH